jgi:hypothetical protein
MSIAEPRQSPRRWLEVKWCLLKCCPRWRTNVHVGATVPTNLRANETIEVVGEAEGLTMEPVMPSVEVGETQEPWPRVPAPRGGAPRRTPVDDGSPNKCAQMTSRGGLVRRAWTEAAKPERGSPMATSGGARWSREAPPSLLRLGLGDLDAAGSGTCLW